MKLGPLLGLSALGVGLFALSRKSSAAPAEGPTLSALPSAPTMLTPVIQPVKPPPSVTASPGLVDAPVYLTKYTADALNLIAIPGTATGVSAAGSPPATVKIIRCLYYPFFVAEATDLGSAQALYYSLKTKYETAPETFRQHSGRLWITRLRKRFFDPKTFKELPSDVIMQSDQAIPVPIWDPLSSDKEQGVPCG